MGERYIMVPINKGYQNRKTGKITTEPPCDDPRFFEHLGRQYPPFKELKPKSWREEVNTETLEREIVVDFDDVPPDLMEKCKNFNPKKERRF